MSKVVYFHGLESSQGGPKVEFLSSKVPTLAPSMDYKNFKYKDFKKLLATITPNDVVIGSSMGGYLADIVSTHIGCRSLLFNPAFHSRSLELHPQIKHGIFSPPRVIVLGKEDKVINPQTTKCFIEKYDIIEEVEGMGHRTTFDVFVDMYNKHISYD